VSPMRNLEAPSGLTHASSYRIVTRWWWAIVAGALIGAMIGFASGRNSPAVYEADALVVASSSSIQAADFGPLAEAAFATNTVIQPVIDELGLRTTPQSLLASEQLRAKSVSGTVALRITGRSRNGQLASDLASAAADSFASAATDRQMGTFAVFGPGGVPGTRQPPLTRQNTLLGALGGASIAMVLVLLFVVVRRPLLTIEQAALEFPAQASFAARVRLPLSNILPWRIHRMAQIRPRGLVPAIWHMVEAHNSVKARRVCCVLVTRGRHTSQSLVAMLQVLKAQSQMNAQHVDQLVWAHFDAPLMPHILDGATAVVALVAAGAPRRSLQALDEELQTALVDMTRILVLVRRDFHRIEHVSAKSLGQPPMDTPTDQPIREPRQPPEWNDQGQEPGH
jgi:hypothetical protein